MKFLKVSLFLILAVNFSEFNASSEYQEKHSQFKASATGSIREKLRYLNATDDDQGKLLKEANKLSDQRGRIDSKILIGEYIVGEVMKTVDPSIKSEDALYQQYKRFIKENKKKTECLQWVCLKCCSCCPERLVQELPADTYVEAAQDILTNRSFALHPMRESQTIPKEHRS